MIAARAAAAAAAATEPRARNIDLSGTTSFKIAKPQKSYYLPTFAGTYASPSRYWINRAQP